MVTVPESHDVSITAPWYVQDGGQNVAMHRYFDGGFVDSFRADVNNRPELNGHLFDWQNEDVVTDPTTGATKFKLRRPMHRTFYMVAWEAGCNIPNALTTPAISPTKIESAGFVIRQDDASSVPYGFQLARGQPMGWQKVVPLLDPDSARRLRSLGIVPQQVPTPGYTGEETFPLHTLLAQGAGRSRTVLFGYLPIGGAHYVPVIAPPTDPAGVPDDLAWPYGLLNWTGGPLPPYTDDLDLQIIVDPSQGPQIQPPLAAALAVILGRFQLVDASAWNIPDNASLIAALDGIHFFTDPPSGLTGQPLRDNAAANALADTTLGSVLNSATTLTNIGTNADSNQSAASQLLAALMSVNPPGSVVTCPANFAALLPAGSQSLLITEYAAAQLRAAIQTRRVLEWTALTAPAPGSEPLPVPKFTAGPAGRYYLLPFVRTVKPDGCKRIDWGLPSPLFAVATAFDPDASRPTLIEMPDIADAKKGLAKGATFMLPPALADLVNGLTSQGAVNSMMSGSGPPAVGIRFICSFSLPVIMICAMLLLSIVISLLNIFLQWMAWVKICLPVPAPKSPPP
jgi:hypothetical protein